MSIVLERTPSPTGSGGSGKGKSQGKGKGGKGEKGKGEPKVRGKGKGKGKGAGKATLSSRDSNPYSSEVLAELLANNLDPEAIYEYCQCRCSKENIEKGTAAQKVAMPLLAELRDLVLAAQPGSLDPVAVLIPRIQGIISEAKLLQTNSLESTLSGTPKLPLQSIEAVVKAGELIHATKYAYWEAIKAEGLRGDSSIDFVVVNTKSKRGCIAGVIGADLLIYVDINKATQDGILFSKHGSQADTITCQSASLNLKYFSKVVDIRSGELVWDLSHGGSVKDAEYTPERLRQMKLYSNSRIKYSLHKAIEIAYANAHSLKCSDFGFMDQLHYLGYECIDDFFGRFAPHLRNAAAPVIDIGVGLGGSARYMWEQYGARVTGIEYQPELAKIFTTLNNLLRIPSGDMSIEQGDFAHMDLAYLGLEGQFSAFTSQLVFLHIADKESLFEKCGLALKEGGYFMIEDYYVTDGADLEEQDKRWLDEDVSVPNGMPSYETKYKELLAANGMVVDEWLDMTDRWCTFIWERCETFLGARPALEQEHGAEYGQEQAHFFAAVANLFHKLPEGDRLQRFPSVCQHINWQTESETKPQYLRGVRIFGHKVSPSTE